MSLLMKHENNKNKLVPTRIVNQRKILSKCTKVLKKRCIFWPINSSLRTLCQERNSKCSLNGSIHQNKWIRPKCSFQNIGKEKEKRDWEENMNMTTMDSLGLWEYSWFLTIYIIWYFPKRHEYEYILQV